MPALVSLDRDALLARYRDNRVRSRALFDLVADEAYYSRPIALRHPLVFYEGHLPGFSFNTLVKKALGGASIDARLEQLFARGIDPHEAAGTSSATAAWPSRAEVRAFADEADRRVIDALRTADIERPGDPLLDRGEAAYAVIEHEAMHQETLLYMWHRLPFDQKKTPLGYAPRVHAPVPSHELVDVPGGVATLGVNRDQIRFGWDNEHPACRAEVAPFTVERHSVTNAQYLEFVEAGGYTTPALWRPEDWSWIQGERVQHPLFWERDDSWQWRGMFARVALPLTWPVYVSYAEAHAYARWRGARLMTEGEYQRAAYGSAAGERRYPWGDEAPTAAHGVFDFSSWDPEPVGTHPTGMSAWGIHDLVGNGWEWTQTTFGPFPGFRAMASYPEYSADFFDGEHVVMKGASPATSRDLLRPTFRNWFRARYPYVYAKFRCVTNSA